MDVIVEVRFNVCLLCVCVCVCVCVWMLEALHGLCVCVCVCVNAFSLVVLGIGRGTRPVLD
jgi:hypothetical protein